MAWKQVVAAELKVADEGERRVRSLDLGHRDRAVQRHDRARGERQELDSATICDQSVAAAAGASLWTA